MINEQNIYEKGVLVSLHMGGYAGRKKLDKDQMKDLPTEIVRGVHDMFDKNFKATLDNIWTLDFQAREAVKAKTVPFPIDGIYFLATNRIDEVVNFLEETKQRRESLIEEAVESYEDAIGIFAEKYPDYYRKARNKYPSKAQFQEKFYFKYQFLKIAPPDENGPLTASMYKKEMTKFKESVNEMKTEVLSIVAQTLLESVERLKSQCTDGKPNQKTFNNLNKFLLQIDNTYSDFIDRKDLKDVIDGIKASILGVDAESLRSQDDFKKEFKKAISSAADCIKALPDVKLKRSIEF